MEDPLVFLVDDVSEVVGLAERYGLPTEQAAVLSTVDALAHAVAEPDNG